MRRIGLFAVFLLLLGLTTAVASSFDVQAEDIASFSTDVDISVPDPPTASGTFFLRGPSSVLPGLLDSNPDETTSDPVRTKAVELGTLGVQAQTAVDFHHSWETPAAPVGGLQLSGPAFLRIYQNGGTDRLTAALFDCASGAATSSSDCTQLTADVTSPLDGETGYAERTVDFGTVSATITEGRHLRVQIVNFVSSTRKWSAQWGYKSNRPSRLDVTLATP